LIYDVFLSDFRRGERSGNARLSYTDYWGYREYCWKT